MKKIPPYIASCLWSYDISKLDLQKDKKMIIAQVLNYGDFKSIKWLYNIYPEKTIKEVIKNPKRGFWFEKVLNFWLTLFNIHLSNRKTGEAILSIEPG
ncbi:MAG: hypothetical protein ABIG90_00125 [bacterium]